MDHMVQACEELFVCMDGVNSAVELESSVVKRRAVVMCLLDLGEMFKSLTEDEINQYPSENWKNFIGFRNRASHGYHTMNFAIVYSLATEKVSPLYEFLKNKQQELTNDEENDKDQS